MAGLYKEQGKYVEAEPLYKNALRIWEKVLGTGHLDVAAALNNLALVYKEQGKYEEAEPLYARSLNILENVLGIDHPKVKLLLENYALLLWKMGRKDDIIRIIGPKLRRRSKNTDSSF